MEARGRSRAASTPRGSGRGACPDGGQGGGQVGERRRGVRARELKHSTGCAQHPHRRLIVRDAGEEGDQARDRRPRGGRDGGGAGVGVRVARAGRGDRVGVVDRVTQSSREGGSG